MRILLVALLAFSMQGIIDADDADDRAESFLADFIVARSELPNTWGCVVHATRIEGEPGKDLGELELTSCFLKSEDYELSASKIFNRDRSASDVWEVFYTTDKDELRRYGFGNKGDQIVDIRSLKKSQEAIRPPKHPRNDFFNLPISDDGSFVTSSVEKTFAERIIVLNGELLKSSAQPMSKLATSWRVAGKPGAVVSIIFDKAADNFPVETTWRVKKSSGQSDLDALKNDIDTRTRTSYREVRLAGKHFRLPHKISIEWQDTIVKERFASTEMHLKWFGEFSKIKLSNNLEQNWIVPIEDLILDKFPYDEADKLFAR